MVNLFAWSEKVRFFLQEPETQETEIQIFRLLPSFSPQDFKAHKHKWVLKIKDKKFWKLTKKQERGYPKAKKSFRSEMGRCIKWTPSWRLNWREREKEEPHKSKTRGWREKGRKKSDEEANYSLVQCHSFLLQAFEGPLFPSLCHPHHLSLSVRLQSSQSKYLDSLCYNFCSWQVFSAPFFR